MKCFDEAIIQTYIDKECSAEEEEAVRAHLQTCAVCSTSVEHYLKRSQQIKNLLNSPLTQQREAPAMPPFVKPKAPKRILRQGIKWFSAVASIVVILLALNHFHKAPNAYDYFLYQTIDFKVDANKPISQQDFTMQLIDPHGNTIFLDETKY
ncbi:MULTISPECIES: anti-sigma factor family protein [unclassified Carboxylicivirga]|uniref:anti-sigma factor family protein n=1 Tax=Carboxylicivirga TaxID=1628153 RepID=UPI003D330ED6